MSLAPMSVPDRKPSPRLTVNLGSNNPFRNRAVSPSSLPSPGSERSSYYRPERPTSTNPFLDSPDLLSPQSETSRQMSPTKEAPLSGHAAELFENLSLDDKSSKSRRPAPPRPDKDRSSGTRSSTSRKNSEPLLDIFADPDESKPRERPSSKDTRRPRRNSESSVMDRPRKPLDPEEEKKRRERRHREREARHKDGKHRSSKRGPNRKLDIIDKLDVTSIYGTGLFHHDGPFDACNPHRNRKGSRQAPMQAFPKDSRNMALGGAGPNNSSLDLDLFHGRTVEGYTDFSTTAERRKQIENFNSSMKMEPVHGEESMGLGTSTFLEGAPASRAAMQRRESENDNLAPGGGGLQRKKSLAQKIRGMNGRGSTSGRMTSPEPVEYLQRPVSQSKPPVPNRNEKNPFFQDYDDAYDQKGAKIQLAEETTGGTGRSRATSSPRRPSDALERKITFERNNNGLDEGKPAAGGGFMNRMKSLRKPRPERRRSDD